MPPPGMRRPDNATYDTVASWLEQELDRARGRASESGPSRRPASPEPRRVRQRDSRSARPSRSTPAALLPPDTQAHGFDTNADALVDGAGAARSLPDGGREDRAHGRRRSDDAARRRALHRRQGQRERADLAVADRAARRGLSARARAAASPRATTSRSTASTTSGSAWPGPTPTSSAACRRRATSRSAWTACASASSRSAAPGFTAESQDADEPLHVRVPLKAGLRQVVATIVKAEGAQGRRGSDPIGFRSGTAIRDVPDVPALHLVAADRRALQRAGARGLAQPPPHLRRAGPRARARRAGLRDEDSVHAGAPRVSPAGHRRRRPDAAGVLRARPRRGQLRRRHPRRRSSVCSSARTSCSGSRPIRRGVAPGAAYRLPDVELASRLSFFLWSSIPDDELLDAAVKGQLRQPGVLDQQVRRMLADPRARAALVDNFFGQWLQTRNVWLLTPDANTQVPVVRRQPARGVRPRDGSVPRRSAEGGPQHRRTCCRPTTRS